MKEYNWRNKQTNEACRLIDAKALKQIIRGWIADIESVNTKPSDIDEAVIDALENTIAQIDAMAVVTDIASAHGWLAGGSDD